MHRFTPLALSFLVLSACKIERTPPEYYSHRDPAAVEQEEATRELHARVSAFREALNRRDEGGAISALAPKNDARVIALDGSTDLTGRPGIVRAMRSIAAEEGTVVRSYELRVSVNLRGSVGWFETGLDLLPPNTPAREAGQLRLTGVFELDEGEWRLSQLHMSEPRPEPDPTTPVDSSQSVPAEVPQGDE